MFTGIIEAVGTLRILKKEKENLIFGMEAPFTSELRPDQSIAHNGACLTVTEISHSLYFVTAVKETLSRTNLGLLKPGDAVNLERSIKTGDRLDGHFVQGHIDLAAVCTSIHDEKGSRRYSFEYESSPGYLTVSKGSVCVNGVSLTVTDSAEGRFSVSIIPYTYEHTNFRSLRKGDNVNVEFDILGKYIAACMQRMHPQENK